MRIADTDPLEYDRYTFGRYLKSRVEELDISPAQILAYTGFFPEQFKQLTDGGLLIDRPDILVEFAKLLHVDDIGKFFEMAYVAKNGVSRQTISYLAENDLARKFINQATKEAWDEQTWKKIFKLLK